MTAVFTMAVTGLEAWPARIIAIATDFAFPWLAADAVLEIFPPVASDPTVGYVLFLIHSILSELKFNHRIHVVHWVWRSGGIGRHAHIGAPDIAGLVTRHFAESPLPVVRSFGGVVAIGVSVHERGRRSAGFITTHVPGQLRFVTALPTQRLVGFMKHFVSTALF